MSNLWFIGAGACEVYVEPLCEARLASLLGAWVAASTPVPALHARCIAAQRSTIEAWPVVLVLQARALSRAR